jgi:hypothetical protein
MQSTSHSCQILMTLEILRHILEKSSDIKFYENPSSVPCRQTDTQMGRHTDRHLEANSRLSHFAKALDDDNDYDDDDYNNNNNNNNNKFKIGLCASQTGFD